MATKPPAEQRGIHRFPRLTTGLEAAGLVKLLWTEPQIQVRFRRNRPVTQFVFTVPVSREFRNAYNTSYQIIFVRSDWENTVKQAYRDGKYGGKPVAEYVALGLRKVFMDALEIWLRTPMRWGPEYERFVSRASDEFGIASRRKSGPQPEPLYAMFAAKRFDDLLPRVTKLRQDSKNRARIAHEKELIKAIRKVVSWPTASRALERILGEQSSISARQFFLSPITGHQIVSAIVWVELAQRGCDLSSLSLRKYLHVGREILKMLSGLPDARRPAANLHTRSSY
jgi:hypothetical protein